MVLGVFSVISVLVAAMLCVGKELITWLWLLPVGFLGCFLLLLVLFFLVLYIMSLLVNTRREQEQDNPVYRQMAYLVIEVLITLLGVKLNTRGLENTPKEGRFLLVCNHLSQVDPVVLLHCFKKSQLAFISKRENQSMFVVGKIMHKLLCQPINRENDREALKTILKCIDIIRQDKASIAVFPEGYTSLDQKLHPFRSGVFKIAQKTKVPIVVCTIDNSQNVKHDIRRFKRPYVNLHLVRVLRPEDYAGLTTVELGNQIHDMMAEDLGPAYALEENA